MPHRLKEKVAEAMRNIGLAWTIVNHSVFPCTLTELAEHIEQKNRKKGRPSPSTPISVGYLRDGSKLQLFYEQENLGVVVFEADEATDMIKLEVIVGALDSGKIMHQLTWDFASGKIRDAYENFDDFPRKLSKELMDIVLYGLILNLQMREMVTEMPSGNPHACRINQAWNRALSHQVECMVVDFKINHPNKIRRTWRKSLARLLDLIGNSGPTNDQVE